MICAVVLAAGKSRRMGRPKLLLPFDDQPLITRVVGAIPSDAVRKIIVVTRDDDQTVADVLGGLDVTIVTNSTPDGDMLSSVRCGIRALPESCAAVLVVLGDQPGISPDLVRSLVDMRQRSGASIVVPRGPAGRGHPLLVDLRHRDEILTCFQDVGLRGLLAAHPDEAAEVPVPDAAALADIDTPEDYARLAPKPQAKRRRRSPREA